MGSKVYQDINVTLLVDKRFTNPTNEINKYREAVAEYIDALEMVHNVTSTIVQAHNNHESLEYDYWCDALPRYEEELAHAKIKMDDIETLLFRMTHPNV